jgi:hypothetical protein
MPSRVQAQLALDEHVIDDSDLEDALEERHRLRVLSSEHRKAYDEADEAAGVEIAKLELPDGQAVRCGRFRITRTARAARSVAFETKASSRVRITLLEDEE